MADKKKDKQYSAPALEKGLEILELLLRSPEPMGQSEIARELGRSSNEIFRMLSVLEASRYLLRDSSSGEYLASMKLFSLSRHYRPLQNLINVAREPMRCFSEETGQECHLSVLEESNMVVLYEQRAPMSVGIFLEAGSTHNPLRTVSGRLLLAQLEEQERERSLQLIAETYGETSKKVKEVEQTLNKMQSDDSAEAQDESLRGLSDLSTLILASDSVFSAALATTFFSSTLDAAGREKLKAKLIRCAADIRERLGHARARG